MWRPLLLFICLAAVGGAAEAPRSDISRFDVSRSDFIALQREIDYRFESQQRAVDKAEVDLNKRLDSVNEFRKQLADETASFLTRNEYNQAHASLVDKVAELSKRLDAADNRSGGLSAGWGYLVGAVGVAALLYQTVKKK